MKAIHRSGLVMFVILLIAGLRVSLPAQAHSTDQLVQKPLSPKVASCFTQAAVPNPSTGGGSRSIKVLSATDAWEIGSNQTSGSYHWNGTNWSSVALPAKPAYANELYYNSIDGSGPNDVWAVGFFDGNFGATGSYVIHWDGASWSIVSDGSTGTRLYGVSVISANDAWAVGFQATGNTSVNVALHWNGTTWTQIAVPNNQTYNTLYGVAGLATNDVWAVGTTSGSGTQAPTAFHWDGVAWSNTTLPSATYLTMLRSVAPISTNDVWAVGETTDINGVAQDWAVHWNGSTWSQVSVPPVAILHRLTAVKAIAGEVYVTGIYSNGGASNISARILHWNGASWDTISVANPGTNTQLTGIDGIGGEPNIWAVGNYLDAQSNGVVLIERACPANTPTATATGTLPTATATGTSTATSQPTGTTTATATNTASLTPTATPTIGNYCAYVSWTNRVNTTIDSAGHLRKVAGQNGHWDAGAVSTLAILSAPACYRIDPGSIALGTEQVVGLTHHEDSASYSDIDYGIYLGITGTLGVVDGGTLITGTFGTYAANDELNISIEGDPLVANFYHNNVLFYTSALPPQLPLYADTSIATMNGSISPSRVCANGPPPAGSPTATPCSVSFHDVTDTTAYYYQPVQYLACRGVIGGYSDGTYRPFNNTTRGQMAKIVVGAFALPITTPTAGAYTFADAPPSSTFFSYIETAVARGVITGYPCGGTNPQTGAAESCDQASRPYYRVSNNVTRGQLTKIVVIGAGWPTADPQAPTFTDVARGSTFYTYIESAVCRGIINGYSDYSFRPNNSAFRGQIAKIVAGAATNQAGCPLAPAP